MKRFLSQLFNVQNFDVVPFTSDDRYYRYYETKPTKLSEGDKIPELKIDYNNTHFDICFVYFALIHAKPMSPAFDWNTDERGNFAGLNKKYYFRELASFMLIVIAFKRGLFNDEIKSYVEAIEDYFLTAQSRHEMFQLVTKSSPPEKDKDDYAYGLLCYIYWYCFFVDEEEEQYVTKMHQYFTLSQSYCNTNSINFIHAMYSSLCKENKQEELLFPHIPSFGGKVDVLRKEIPIFMLHIYPHRKELLITRENIHVFIHLFLKHYNKDTFNVERMLKTLQQEKHKAFVEKDVLPPTIIKKPKMEMNVVETPKVVFISKKYPLIQFIPTEEQAYFLKKLNNYDFSNLRYVEYKEKKVRTFDDYFWHHMSKDEMIMEELPHFQLVTTLDWRKYFILLLMMPDIGVTELNLIFTKVAEIKTNLENFEEFFVNEKLLELCPLP